MYLNTKIQDHEFRVCVGSGLNDWGWLSHYVARKFSKISYPQGNYLPTHLEILDGQGRVLEPPPKEKISIYLEANELKSENVTVLVRIRKPNHYLTEEERIWQRDAFGLERFMMSICYILETNSLEPNKKDNRAYYFKVVFEYHIHNEVKHIFANKEYPARLEVELEEKSIAGTKLCTFSKILRLPFGTVTPELYYYWRDPKDPGSFREEKVKDLKKKQDFRVTLTTSPKFMTIESINLKTAEEMKISEDITKSLQEKQLEAKKRNANYSLCCFTFEELWRIIEDDHGQELFLDKYDASTLERLKIILQKSINSIYEIFFYYFIIESQTKEKKEELGITYQHVMHFLRFYSIFADFTHMRAYMEYYNSDFKYSNIKDTLDIHNKAVRFPQFVAILLRAIQFAEASTFMVKGETFDVSVAKIIDKVIEIDGEEEEFNQFRRNLRENHKIISYFRSNEATLKEIYANQILRSTQYSVDHYVMMKQEFKSLLEKSGLTNKNTDDIVADLFAELMLSDESVFYYEFLEAIQWLALGLVSSDKDDTSLPNEEEHTLLLIEKVNFFVQKIID